MTDSIIIWKFLNSEFPDDHQAIYLYVCGNVRSPQTAIDQIMRITRKVFCPAISEEYVKMVVKGFLDRKKRSYINGEIKVKPLY